MKRFVFRLERLLNFRHSMEMEQARRLGDVQRVEQERQRAADQARARLANAESQLESAPPEHRTAGTIANLGVLVDAAREANNVAQSKHREAALRTEEERIRYEQARKARRTMERLREHRHGEWQLEANHEEQDAIDEVALRKHRSGQNQ